MERRIVHKRRLQSIDVTYGVHAYRWDLIYNHGGVQLGWDLVGLEKKGVAIQDSKLRMTVLSEQAQGTASLQDGSIEIWLDRRLAQNDNRGLFQGAQDNRPTRTRFRLLLETGGYDPDGEYRLRPF
jgi:hypothetical protein